MATNTIDTSIVVLSPDQLEQLVCNAVRRAMTEERGDMHRPLSPSSPQFIRGKKEIMDYLGLRNDKSYYRKVRDYPDAFYKDATFVLLNVEQLHQLISEKDKMTISAKRRIERKKIES